MRVAHFALLLVGRSEPFTVLSWTMLAGTSAMVLFGHFPLGRTPSLLRWNRREPLTLDLVRRTSPSRPVRGSLLDSMARLAAAEASQPGGPRRAAHPPQNTP